MLNEIKVIVSPTRPPRVASVIGDQIFYDELAEGEKLVTHDGFSGKYKPNFVKGVWIETATPEEIEDIEANIIRPRAEFTANQLFEYLDLIGVIPKEGGYEPRKE